MTNAKGTDCTTNRVEASASHRRWAAVAGVGWAWAVTLIASRDHDAVSYRVIQLLPPAWGMVGIPVATLLAAAVAALAAGGW